MRCTCGKAERKGAGIHGRNDRQAGIDTRFQGSPVNGGFCQAGRAVGCAISGHSGDLAPAEAIFYELRDVTGTVPSIPLITSSIISKKIAGGASSFVFDVKCGSGAFMGDPGSARRLAEELVNLSAQLEEAPWHSLRICRSPLDAGSVMLQKWAKPWRFLKVQVRPIRSNCRRSSPAQWYSWQARLLP